MLATISSAVVDGIDGLCITIEVINTGTGTPRFTVVGLPDTTIRESRDRVRAALMSSGYKWPSTLPLTVNLAPSDVRKHGAGLDLPLALGVLVASKQLEQADVAGVAAVGELGLDGSIRRVPGLVSLAEAMSHATSASGDGAELVVPLDGASEAAIVAPGRVRGADRLRDLVEGLRGEGPLPALIEAPAVRSHDASRPELGDVRGQPLARWALEVAAAGGHHALMVGPPGAGKTMLASRLSALLPPLDAADAMTVARIHSAAGLRQDGSGLDLRPPFRAPHHGMSSVALIGGGTSSIRPGEISNAHGGVLFLDELGEFPRSVIDAMRQPLEEGVVRISRAHGAQVIPSRFQLVAASNPCPCGNGWTDGTCRCSEAQRRTYAMRFSDPLLDRFDIRIEVSPPEPRALLGRSSEEATADVAPRVAAARQLARSRGVRSNAELTASQLEASVPLSDAARLLLERELLSGSLTARGFARVWRVARTVADLAGAPEHIQPEHVQAALLLRIRVGALLGAPA